MQMAMQARRVGNARLFSLFLVNVKMDLGRERKGLVALGVQTPA